ncbi:hypothetical protein SASPL_141412 [Salvia splendens]|uniref:RRM domain-containing protein n=1 Tax=Salvia splendens TaxID=180675 RepID=A0A8X8ZCA8_SALSN|nr:nuclear transport factor 2-like [Salvia splendens]XP_042020035.1 nuclear transport factor 2-like [Salvia splendens]XP_042020036.1 nuclear transport factor 2-like [Salvia splendens]XP_042020037.1 nuclear transport factor 2-like [Salvia splendens]XP_042020038.1 nuclear transport factor 2-like [Salvia splendens]KAG6399927.1 hypothetical protein SASPL_141412 [Salvia splendens]
MEKSWRKKGTKPQPVDTPDVKPSASNVTTKITYASMLAKETPAVSPSGGVSSSSKVAPESPSAYSEAKGIYIGGLPYDITKQGVIDVVKQFGQVKNDSDTVQIIRHEDGFCCGFVEFESADSARHAVEAHHVMFGEKEAYIMPKKPYNRGNKGRARPTMRRGPHNDNSGMTENEDWSNYGQQPRQTNP